MGKKWLKIFATTVIAVLAASNLLLPQSKWNSENCGSFSPTLDRIMINSCTSNEPDEYFIFHTNKGSLNVTGSQLSIQVNVTNGPYVSNGWGSNPGALEAMNRKSGCKEPLFLDPFASPYNGIIPEQANVIAFVQSNPDFSGALSGLCDQEAIFVLFGNFSHSFIKSMFSNTCSDCTRNIVVKLGSCDYDISYEPDQLANENGEYIHGKGSVVQYAKASNCKPSFYNFQSTPDPIMNRIELDRCTNDKVIDGKFSVMNGNKQTAWYTDLDEEPVARGPTFRPPLSFFPPAFGSRPSSSKIYVRNYFGGRPGDPLELALTTYPAPLSYSISLFCPTDSICTTCKGDQISVGIDINHSNGLGGFPYRKMNLTDGKDSFSVTGLRTGQNVFDLSTSDSTTMTLELISVENKYGCISTNGFASDQLTINLKDSIVDYLSPIPDMCSTDTVYSLPDSPRGLSGQWRLAGDVVTKIDPASMTADTYSAFYIPNETCATADSVQFTIHEASNPEITFPPFECNKKTFRPSLLNNVSQKGIWTVSPSIPVDSVTGEVPATELKSGMTYTWIYTSNQSCTVKVKDSLTIPDCKCMLQGEVKNVICHDNGTPADSTDDTFTFGLTLSGQNHSTGWQTVDGTISGTFDSIYTLGPYPIAEGTRKVTIRDQKDAACQTTFTIDPPDACSNTCEMTAETSDIMCHDNGTPADSTDDSFAFGLTLSGQNHSSSWQTLDGTISGTFDSVYTMGPYPIADGTRTVTIRDQTDADCQTTFTIDPPDACSNTCEITAETSDIMCHDNGTPADSTDDSFTFGLTLSGQNHSTGWQTVDGTISGTFDSIYTMGPYPIAEGTRTVAIRDQTDAACQTTFTIDPPDACSNTCEITAETSDIMCHDNGTPADSTDDSFTFGLTLSGQNHSTGWQTVDGTISGTFDSVYTMGPYPISEGTRTVTIRDQTDAACQTTITIDPPETCSKKCRMEVIVKDSCFLDSDNRQQIYYFLKINIPKPDPQFWIYHKNKLVEIIPGTGNIPIGPFTTNNIGDEIRISYDKNPNCVEEIQLPASSTCEDFNKPTCKLEIKNLNIVDCQINNTNGLSEINLNVRIQSTEYPVELFASTKLIANIPDSNLYTYSFSTSLPQPENGNILITLLQSDHCTKTYQLQNTCQNTVSYFPNAFSPNQDGQNDQWIARIPAESELMSAAVYDRWGNRVFMSTRPGMPDGRIIWDGKAGGQNAEPGTYLYKIAWKKAGITKNKTGEIFLLR